MVIKGAQAHAAGDISLYRLSALRGQRMSPQRLEPVIFWAAGHRKTVRFSYHIEPWRGRTA